MQIKPIAFVSFLCLVLLFAPVQSFSQTTTINTSLCGCQPPNGSPCPGTTNHIMYTFAFNITSGCPSFTAINGFVTSGTYMATDITNFKLYETNFSVFNTSTLVATITTGLGPGAHTFSGYNRTTCAAAQRYYWITCDFPAGAVAGRTININIITNAMYALTGTKNYGTNTAAGTMTICNPLPVSLVSFTADPKENETVVHWETSSETNNDFFVLERSDESMDFQPVARIEGSGTTTLPSSYTYIDYNRSADQVVYYRLRQTDENGQSKYVGGILSVNPKPPELTTIRSNGKSLFVHLPEDPCTYTIVDVYGRIHSTGLLEAGSSVIDISGLMAGTYILEVNDRTMTRYKFAVFR